QHRQKNRDDELCRHDPDSRDGRADGPGAGPFQYLLRGLPWAAGDGKGVPTKFGMAVIADLHDVKARRVPQQSDGEIFYTITYGKNLMQGYGAQIPINDRWAIIAYLRALQRSRLATLEDVPANVRDELSRALPAT